MRISSERRVTQSWWRAVVGALFAACLLGLPVMAAAQGVPKDLTKVRIGMSPIADTLIVWIGKDEGIFKEEGLDVDIQVNAGGAVGIPAIEGGSLDIQHSDVATIFRGVAQGLKLRIIAPTGNYPPSEVGRSSGHLLGLKDSSIQKLADMRGKRVAVNLLGNMIHLYTIAVFDAEGLKPGDYTVVELPYPQMTDGLLQKQVDMIYQVEPFKTVLVNTGKVRDFGPAFQRVHAGLRIASYMTSERWIASNKDAARRWQKAYYRTVEFVSKHRDRLGDWQVKFLRLKPELKDQVAHPTFGDIGMGQEYAKSLLKTRDIMLKYGFLKGNVDPEALIYRAE